MSKNEYYAELVARDTPMPMGRYIWESEAYKDKAPADTCGRCGRHIVTDDYVFCPVCGQRIDRKNYKL